MNHPDCRADGGTAILMKQTIKHHKLLKYEDNFLQVTSIKAISPP